MKGIVLSILCTISAFSLVAQATHKDSLASQIALLEKSKTDLVTKVETLSSQLTELFSMQQNMKNRIQEIDEELGENKDEIERLHGKKELLSSEKKKLEGFKKMKADRSKLAKSIAEHDVRFNKQLALLDQTVGMRNELNEKINELKAMYGTL